MKRRTVLKGALAAGATLAMPAIVNAQAGKKISLLTWNIPDQEALFKEEFADFRGRFPGVEIEWLDKKGPELPVFYQTQLVAGTPPDIINTQGALWLEYAANGALLETALAVAKVKLPQALEHVVVAKVRQRGASLTQVFAPVPQGVGIVLTEILHVHKVKASVPAGGVEQHGGSARGRLCGVQESSWNGENGD